MRKEKFWNGFILGYTIGGITGIVVLNLIQIGIL